MDIGNPGSICTGSSSLGTRVGTVYTVTKVTVLPSVADLGIRNVYPGSDFSILDTWSKRHRIFDLAC